MVYFFIEALAQKDIIWGISVDVLFTTFVTIFIFILGLLFTRLYDRSKEKKRLKDIKTYFISVTESLLNPMERIAKYYRDLSKSIAAEEQDDFFLAQSHDLFLDSIKGISSVDLFKVLISDKKCRNNDKKSVHFKKVYDTIEFVRIQNERIKANFTYFNSEYRIYSDQWNENVNSVSRLFDNFKSINIQNGIKPSQDEFLNKLDRIFYKASSLENYRNMWVLKKHLIDPIKQLCVETEEDPRAMMLMSVIMNCRMAFENINRLKEVFSYSFQDEAKKLEEIRDSFIKTVEFFKGTNPK